MRLRTDFIRVGVQRQAVFNLLHLAGQTVPGERIELMGQGEVSQYCEEHHQQCSKNTHGQPQP
ncbi:hypothetical protein D3C72_2299400 [compost metagenome]